MKAINLFGGPGGTCLGAKSLGIDPLGIERDDAACATRKAAGLRTLQADVSKLDPLDFAPCELILASAPCPTFSAAGNGGGRLLTDLIVRCLHELAAGNDTRAECRDEAYEVLAPIYWEREQEKARKKKREADGEKAEARARRDADMSLLVVEPLRWVLALRPRWVMLEQVPEVLGLWSQMAGILDTLGYNCWTGVMEAERYGVPQTRERAILMADREAPVHPPRPTHQRYVKGEPQRHEMTMEGEVLPWVSMAEVLGWGPADELKKVEGEGMVERHGSRPNRCSGEPAFTVRAGTGGIGTGMKRVLRSGQSVAGGDRAERGENEPAVTITSRANNNAWVYDRRQQNSDGSPVPPVPMSEPAPTLTANGLAKSTHANGPEFDAAQRPARTIAGDVNKWTTDNAVRVTEDEALILQSFPPDYPVQGTKRQRFQQIGNAVPPLLAHAILSSLLAPLLEHPTELAA